MASLLQKGVYALEVRIEDGTSSVVAAMSDDVVASLIGVPCSEFLGFPHPPPHFTTVRQLTQPSLANLSTREGKLRSQKLMVEMEEKLFYLEALMKIILPGTAEDLNQDIRMPTIVALGQPTSTDLSQLAARAG